MSTTTNPTATAPKKATRTPRTKSSGVTLNVTEQKQTSNYFVVESDDRRLLPAYLSKALVAEALDPTTGIATITLVFRPSA